MWVSSRLGDLACFHTDTSDRERPQRLDGIRMFVRSRPPVIVSLSLSRALASLASARVRAPTTLEARNVGRGRTFRTFVGLTDVCRFIVHPRQLANS